MLGREKSTDDVLGDPRWFPFDYDLGDRLLTLNFAEREFWAGRRFLDLRFVPPSAHSMQVPAAALHEVPVSPPHLNFIWHISFCGSTLLADLLERPGCNLSLREPQILLKLADALQDPALDATCPSGAIFSLLARRFADDRHLTIKPSNAANSLIARAATATWGKMLFLYCNLDTFLLTVARKGAALEPYIATTYAGLVRTGQLPRDTPPPQAIPFLHRVALVWYGQMNNFRLALAALGPARAASLECGRFLEAPAETLAALDHFFSLGLGREHIAQAVGGPLMQRHAKELRPYNQELRTAELEVARLSLGRSLDATLAWGDKLFPGAAAGLPFGLTLG